MLLVQRRTPWRGLVTLLESSGCCVRKVHFILDLRRRRRRRRLRIGGNARSRAKTSADRTSPAPRPFLKERHQRSAVRSAVRAVHCSGEQILPALSAARCTVYEVHACAWPPTLSQSLLSRCGDVAHYAPWIAIGRRLWCSRNVLSSLRHSPS